VINEDGTYTQFDADGNPVQWGYVDDAEEEEGDGGDGDDGGGDEGDQDDGDQDDEDDDEDDDEEREDDEEPSDEDDSGTMPSDDGGGGEEPGFLVGGRVVAILVGRGSGETDPPSPIDSGLGDLDTAAEEATDIAALLEGHGDSGPPGGGGDTGWGDSSSGESADEPDAVPVVAGHAIPSADETGWGDLNHPNAVRDNTRLSGGRKRVTVVVETLVGFITRAPR
jgi:hypothetical protein